MAIGDVQKWNAGKLAFDELDHFWIISPRRCAARRPPVKSIAGFSAVFCFTNSSSAAFAR